MFALVPGAGSASTDDVVQALRVDRVTAWRALDRLVDREKLASEVEKRMRRYRTPEVVVEERNPEREAVLALVRDHGRVPKRKVVD